MFRRSPKPTDPLVRLELALQKGDHEDALLAYGELEKKGKGEPRWPHKRGDLLRRLGRDEEAIEAYRTAVDFYAARGFLARSIAMAKLILAIDPKRLDILERVDPDEARMLRAQSRTGLARDAGSVAPPARPSPAEGVMAMPLDPEPTTAHEVRFSDAAAPMLRLSAAELNDPTVGEGKRESEDPAKVAELPAVPLLAEVPKEALHRLIQDSTAVETGPGQPIIALGDPADTLHIVVSGQVVVTDASGQEIATLGEGAVFGEGCLIHEGTRQASVHAIDQVTCLNIPRATLEDLSERHPEVVSRVFELLVRRLVASTVRTTPAFMALADATRHDVAHLFELRSAEEGTTIMAEGKKADGLYVLISGEVDITSGGHKAWKSRELYGLSALFSSAPSDTTVRALGEAFVLRLPAVRFKMRVIEDAKDVEALKRVAAGLYDW